VLIVDPLEETSEVLRAALERRGWRILQAKAAEEGLQLAEQESPDVIVFDVDAGLRNPAPWPDRYQRVQSEDCQLIVLGGEIGAAESGTPLRIVPKPYHYAALVHTIEASLSRPHSVVARSA
jgi:DNA-binding response OmpR family regulator